MRNWLKIILVALLLSLLILMLLKFASVFYDIFYLKDNQKNDEKITFVLVGKYIYKNIRINERTYYQSTRKDVRRKTDIYLELTNVNTNKDTLVLLKEIRCKLYYGDTIYIYK